MAHAEHREFEQRRGKQQQNGYRNVPSECRRDCRAGDSTDRCTRSDETEKTLAVFRGKRVDDERPEHRYHEKIEDRDPDEKGAAQPHHRAFACELKREREEEQRSCEETIRDRYETA